ncbi:MAG TPA: TetR/AcrR family transcriptional regulator [Acidobacteriaceae bacterium]|jgi:AcrR family transcriptional regulator|nr:TetR/AcrR family transcriptional regulator [Acidobacteriaceae bacterium]
MKAEKSLSNRDALLRGAKKCLLEKGYNRTTARDIAGAAGVSLAAIGYHFASKEALLTEALLLAFGEWDRDLQEVLLAGVPKHVTPAERFEATWAGIMATFETHRALWAANFEVFAQMVGQEEARRVIADKVHVARAGLAAMFLGQDEATVSEHTVRTTGTLYHVLLSGLVLQWLIDPKSALSAKDLTESLRVMVESLGPRRRGPAKGRASRATR